MITRMKKYTFLVFHRDYEAFLTDLRDAGVVHVTRKAIGLADNSDLQALIARKAELERIIKQAAPDQLLQERNEIEQRIASTRKEQTRVAVWGDFSSKTLAQLKQAGYELHFYTCPKSKYKEEWGVVVKEERGIVYFVVVGTKAALPEDVTEVILNKSADELNADLDGLNALLVASQARIEAWRIANIEKLQNELKDVSQQIDWKEVTLNTESGADGALCILEGFCPEENCSALDERLNALSVALYYESEEPTDEDATPVKLKNGFFARLFEPITRLYSLPNYMEIDLTPFLAPFFMLFFGLCLGDGGYGLILVVAGIYLLLKKPAMKELGWMGVFMGGMTMIVGILTGMFFGINLEEVAFLKPVKDYFITETNHTIHFAGGAYHPMMVFAVGIGIFQILVAMGIKVARITIQKGFKYAVYDLAWLVFLITCIVWLFIAGNITPAGQYIIYSVLTLCGLCILFYSNPDRKVLVLNIGGGLWGTYNMVSGLLGDVLSYIRLFALGLAGGILGNVFNALALQAGGALPAWIGWLPTLLILVLGHTLNFGLCLISSVVHPLRLTFVEFYKNAGFEGGGVEYTPFKK